MRIILLIACLICLCLAIFRKGGNHYSPLDSYIKATNDSYNANAKAEAEAKVFIDSINSK